jgi:hypothetical protein
LDIGRLVKKQKGDQPGEPRGYVPIIALWRALRKAGDAPIHQNLLMARIRAVNGLALSGPA